MTKFVLASAFALILSASLHSVEAFAYSSYPSCGDSKVLNKISKRFNQAENDTWYRGIHMDSISRPHGHDRTGFEDSPIYRQYCHAYANLSNGKSPKVYYLIEEGMGLAGFGWNVEFCVTGLDPWRVYDGYCRTVRP